MSYWLRRASAYGVGFIIPWSLVYQLFGTLFVGQSSPSNPAAWIFSGISFALVATLWAVTAIDGRPYVYRIARLNIVDTHDRPVSRSRVFVHSISHTIDFATAGIGFLWAFMNPGKQTFGEKLAAVRVADYEPIAAFKSSEPKGRLANK